MLTSQNYDKKNNQRPNQHRRLYTGRWTGIRYIIRTADNGNIVDDQTLASNIPSTTTSMYCLIQAFNTGASAAGIAVIDYWGFGKQ
jgi:hypothetical protein